MEGVFCQGCSEPLTGLADGAPCPKCGNPHREYRMTFNLPPIRITPHAGFRMVSGKRVKSDSYSGWRAALEEISGEFVRKDGKGGPFVSKYQKIDRDRPIPWYTKRVVDLTTGEVLRDVSHPLSELHPELRSDKRPK
jgi:hypothetical protein